MAPFRFYLTFVTVNYLAHAFLSNNNADLLVGNFIADHVRGNNFNDYTPGIIEGIYLHRRIDSFTDTHAEFKKAKRVFYDGFEKHSGILVDIYFDHLLASGFDSYSGESLSVFSEKVYKVYTANRHLLPESSSHFLEYAITNNVYSSYAKPEGIQKVLNHLSHRIRHNVRLDESFGLFEKNEALMQQSFRLFFSDMLHHLGYKR